VSSFAAEASLIVAAFELFAVTALTSASRAADLESGDVLTPSGIVEKPEPAAAPAAQITNASPPNVDRYESGPERSPRLSSGGFRCYTPCPPLFHRRAETFCPAAVCAPRDLPAEPTSVTTNPIEPPWKVLPWMDRTAHRYVLVEQIKLVATGSDISFSGKVMDVVA
jgi:hypothetical protein